MTTSAMRTTFLSFVLLFVRGITASGSGKLDPARWPSSSLSPQSPSGSSSNSCDGCKVKRGAKNAHSACHTQCLALKAEISTICDAYPDHKTVKYLCKNCGLVTEGKCSTAADVPTCWCHTLKDSKDQQRNTLSNCRSGLQIVRQFTNALTASDFLAKSPKKRTNDLAMGGKAEVEAVAMYQAPFSDTPIQLPTRPRSSGRRRASRFCFGACGSSRTDSPPPEELALFPGASSSSRPGKRPVDYFGGQEEQAAARRRRAGSPQELQLFPGASSSAGRSSPPPYQPEEDFNSREDGEPEGPFLCTDVRIRGNVVRAMVDTGAAYSVIHGRFGGNMVRTESTAGGTFAGSGQFTVLGETTIDLEIRKGVTIPLTGIVTDRDFELVLGTNFFVAYFVKMRIIQGKMDLRTSRGGVTMKIKFRPTPNWIYMMTGPQPASFQPLEITAILNGLVTSLIVDTGASNTFVSRNLVDLRTLRPTDINSVANVGRPANLLGVTDVNLQIESVTFIITAYVPEFLPTRSLLLGNNFNSLFIQLIDYEAETVTFRFSGPLGYNTVETQAFLRQGE